MSEKKKIIFDLEEFKDFFWSLDLHCSFNELTGEIYWVDGVIIKGKIK